MGDAVAIQQNTNTMHDQMKNELEVLKLAERSASIVLLSIENENPSNIPETQVNEIENTFKPKTNKIVEVHSTSEKLKDKNDANLVNSVESEKSIKQTKNDNQDATDMIQQSEITEKVNECVKNPENVNDEKSLDQNYTKSEEHKVEQAKPENHENLTSDTNNEANKSNSDSKMVKEIDVSIENPIPETINEDKKMINDLEKFAQTVEIVIQSATTTDPETENEQNITAKPELKELKEIKDTEIEGRTEIFKTTVDQSGKNGSVKVNSEQMISDNQKEIEDEIMSEQSSSHEDEIDIESEQGMDVSIITEITIEQRIETDDTIETMETNVTIIDAPATSCSIDTEPLTCVDYLKPISNDVPSSDLSDTDTTDKAEKAYTESGVDDTSRDERDEVSEIENFDLSSCGEDSLEAMYYMIRKNEIIMDRHKQVTTQICEDEKMMVFPEKATDNLEHAVREVSGKTNKVHSIDSMNSSTDDVILKKLSSDSDEIQLHVIPNSEIDSSSSDLKSCPLKDGEQCTANESTDDEYMNPILDSMRKNDEYFNEMQAKALTVHPNRCNSQTDDQPQQQHQTETETDTYNEHLMDDMMRGTIERKILASSVSEADSDYFEVSPTTNRLTKDDFNVSTAFEHMIRTESTTDDSDSTFESAATKIQAGARGFLARRRLRKSSAGTSASCEKYSSFGNAAIDKSLENLVEQHEMHEENVYSESFDDSPTHSRDILNDPTIESIDSDYVLGITEVKVEQRKDDAIEAGNDDETNDVNHTKVENVPGISIQGASEDSATAQRRLMLQRGDAMQRNDTPESSEQLQQQQEQQEQQQKQQPQPQHSLNNIETSNIGENVMLNAQNRDDTHLKTPTKTSKFYLTNAFIVIYVMRFIFVLIDIWNIFAVSKPNARAFGILGPRQRSMPVQIDTQLMRILPKHLKKRIKSANSASSKKANVKRPQLF